MSTEVDIRTYQSSGDIKTIKFGSDEILEVGESDLFYIISEGMRASIYLDSIPDLINALNLAQELWGE